MEVTLFKQTLMANFARYFQSVKLGDANIELKLRIQGFIQAGEVLAIINKEQASNIMEQAHIEVFGETIEPTARQKNGV